uniref:ALIX_LYPXL_bnd domain-containing protein n=1 Tax=Heterorhabditis bacteriophora TaxID=37862 RepID=A0A1I7W8A6_HETBA
MHIYIHMYLNYSSPFRSPQYFWRCNRESFLHSLRIDELELDPSPSDARLPDLLLERNATLTTQLDAIPNLLENLQKVDDMAREADARLTELNSRLLAVDLPELVCFCVNINFILLLQIQHILQTSDDGYKAVSKEIERLTDHHHQARSNNVELHKAIADHATNLHLLSLPLAELSGKLITNTTNPGNSHLFIVLSRSTKEGMALRHVLDKTREMQTQRSVLVQRLCEEMNADNVTKKLLAERSSDHKITYIAELKKHEELIKYIDANLTAQAKILSVLTEANADFSEYRKQIKAAANSRSEQIMALVTAFDVYNDVCNKAVEGKRFYTKLLDRVDKMSQAVGGIETACNN